MKTVTDIVLVVGFVLVDFFFFHDALKAGEVISLAQYLTGALSLVVIVRSLASLFGGHGVAGVTPARA